MKRLVTLFLSLFLVLSTVGMASAAPFGYGIDTGFNFWEIDLGVGSASLIGNTGVFLEGIAMSPTGELFGTSTAGNLYSINAATAALTLIGNTGLGNLEGLDFNGSTLVASDFFNTPTLYSLDTTTAAATSIVTAASSTGLVRAMTTLDSDTMLIRTDASNFLRSIDLTTGVTTLIGDLGGLIFAGMDFAEDGYLYGLDEDGKVYIIDPSTAGTTFVGDAGAQFWLGLAARSVPEPATLLLLGTGLVGLVGMRRKFRT